MFRVDDPRSESRILHDLTQNKMLEDAESDIAIRFSTKTTTERSPKAVSAKKNLKKIALPLLYRANRTAGKFLTH